MRMATAQAAFHPQTPLSCACVALASTCSRAPRHDHQCHSAPDSLLLCGIIIRGSSWGLPTQCAMSAHVDPSSTIHALRRALGATSPPRHQGAMHEALQDRQLRIQVLGDAATDEGGAREAQSPGVPREFHLERHDRHEAGQGQGEFPIGMLKKFLDPWCSLESTLSRSRYEGPHMASRTVQRRTLPPHARRCQERHRRCGGHSGLVTTKRPKRGGGRGGPHGVSEHVVMEHSEEAGCCGGRDSAFARPATTSHYKWTR